MGTQLLMIAWEYQGYHSVQGAALARRITQVAEAFQSNGWKVTVIHVDQRNESKDAPFSLHIEANGVRRIAVKLTSDIYLFPKNPIIRRLSTLWYVATMGDRSTLWAKDVLGHFQQFALPKPDAIVAFYTPRGPLYLGNFLANKLGVPWVADIQDPVCQGVAAGSRKLALSWMRRTLSTARSIVHISPEWGNYDARELGLPIQIVRHAIPFRKALTATELPEAMRPYANSFRVFYGGSISSTTQSLDLLKQILAFAEAQHIDLKLFVAGNHNARQVFKDALREDQFVYLGWLPADEMKACMAASHCLLLIPWHKERNGIPSKFYEYCSLDKPIWIVGPHLGAFDSLFKEWQHPILPTGDLHYQQQTLTAAVQGDFSGMFLLSACKGQQITEENFYDAYVKLLG